MNSTIKKTTLFLGACMAFQLGGIPQMLAAPSTSMEVMQQTKRITGTVKTQQEWKSSVPMLS